VFCPNCGAPNPDTATTCQKCGFNVKGTAAPKFKGTMVMQGGPPVAPGAPGLNPAMTPPMPTATPAGPTPGAPMPGIPRPDSSGSPTATAPSSAVNSQLKGTMIGVAPPGTGGIAPPGGSTQQSPGAPGAPGGFPAPAAPGMSPAPGSPYGAPMPGAPAHGAPGAYPGAPQPHVNALDSTVAAGSAMSPFAGGAQPQGMPQPGAPGGVPGSPYGMPPNTPGMPQSGASAAAPSPPVVAPGVMPGAGTPAPTQPGMEAVAAPPGAMTPAQPGMPAGAVPYQPPGAAPGAPAGGSFQQRSPFMVFLLAAITCSIYSIFWFHNTANELKAKGQELPAFWHVFIPILGLIWMWKWCKALDAATQGQISAGMSLILMMLLGPIGMAMIQSKMNAI